MFDFYIGLTAFEFAIVHCQKVNMKNYMPHSKIKIKTILMIAFRHTYTA